MSDSSRDLEAYRQASEDLRHFSTMRLSVLGAFTAFSGGLFALAVEKLKYNHAALSALSFFNVAVSIACAMLELRINDVAEFYAKKVDTLASQLGMGAVACSAPPKAAFGKWRGSLLTYVVYAGSIAMWLYAWRTL